MGKTKDLPEVLSLWGEEVVVHPVGAAALLGEHLPARQQLLPLLLNEGFQGSECLGALRIRRLLLQGASGKATSAAYGCVVDLTPRCLVT